uniref:GRF-type domain-containing protein n=1 Tax=Nelumbo nucifera TaxID=4432 RepID=A0A822YV97_NELNU|nr:TPA_asm: hypothetical protein HUJ06_012029 [Nelumbo nucifera]
MTDGMFLPNCSCGKGEMTLQIARTETNYGRWFLCCPVRSNHRSSSVWVDEFGGIRHREPRVEVIQ